MAKTFYQNLPYSAPDWCNPVRVRPHRRLRLGQLPTPLVRWDIPGIDAKTTCYIKRDDCTGITLSGNKVRKLEFLLADAIERGCDVIVTCGGVQSNHCRATAVAARELGLDSVLFLRTSDTGSDPGWVGNLMLDRLVGAEIKLITPAQFRDRFRLMAACAAELEREGRKAYVIPEGGSNGLGSWGYIEAVRELGDQLAAQRTQIDDLVFACGSGGTAAGLCLGAHLSALGASVHAVNVCDDADYFYRKVDEIFDELGAPARSRDLLEVIDGYVGLGYAKSRPEELQLLRDVALHTGVILDPVYTGKALFGLVSELRRAPDRFRGRRILFLHSGGLFGLYDKVDELSGLYSSSPNVQPHRA